LSWSEVRWPAGAAEVAGAGRRSVEETIEGMEGIQRQMTAIADSIINLSTQSQAIGEIITARLK
jgi:methyl-accepting chemotaxis protein